ncbi:MAG: DUF1080 domain-containing protein [Planctomycetota bacterium]
MTQRLIFSSLVLGVAIALAVPLVFGDEVPVRPNGPPPSNEKPAGLPKAVIDGTGPGWIPLGKDDLVNTDANKDAWTWQQDVLHCSGKASLIRSKKSYANFELILEWRLQTVAGNSGIFVWADEKSLASLKPRGAPVSIEVQILDHAYANEYEKKQGQKSDWFTTHGDVFAVEGAKMTPFPPVGARGMRSFPRKNLSKGAGEWNHYYIRAINGEIRLWVNGEEVSGGTDITPRSGYLCLEGGYPSLVDFRNIRIRELP